MMKYWGQQCTLYVIEVLTYVLYTRYTDKHTQYRDTYPIYAYVQYICNTGIHSQYRGTYTIQRYAHIQYRDTVHIILIILH